MRNLASIQKIKSIEPIPDADNIEVAVVNDWKVVVKKGEYKAGDTCIYCEIDSFLPIKPEYEFLRKTSYKKMGEQEGFRLKSIRLRQVVSQGLLLPTSVLPDDCFYYIGEDVSELLGIVKYEPPIPAELAGIAAGSFPSSVPKTDQERCQNLSKEWEEYQSHKYEVTEKLEGSSLSVIYNKLAENDFSVCSRNLSLKETEGNTFWKVVRESNLEENLRKLGRNLAIQGELIGPGIQGNIYKLNKHMFYAFDIFDIDKQEYLKLTERHAITEELNLNHVPVICHNQDISNLSISDLLEMAEGISCLYNTQREGIVFKSLDSKHHFKAVSNKYLLKQKD